MRMTGDFRAHRGHGVRRPSKERQGEGATVGSGARDPDSRTRRGSWKVENAGEGRYRLIDCSVVHREKIWRIATCMQDRTCVYRGNSGVKVLSCTSPLFEGTPSTERLDRIQRLTVRSFVLESLLCDNTFHFELR